MKTIIQTREILSSEYKGTIYEKIIMLCDHESDSQYLRLGNIEDGGIKYNVLDVKVYENFNPFDYVKTAKPIKIKQL
jgi:hypothetical protein